MSSENAFGLSRSAWISLGVFAILLVLVVVTREDRMEAGIRKLELVKIEKAQVERIEVSDKHSAVLERDGAGWVVYDPKTPDEKHAAESSSVEAALDAVAELEADTFVTGRAEKHKELEIDDESGLAVKITGKDGRVLDVVFGRFAKGGGNYLRLKGSNEVFVGKGRLASLLKKDVNGWRKRKLLDVEADALTKIVVEPAGGAPYTLEGKKGEGEAKKTWSFAEGTELPAGFRVDEAALARVASTLAALRAADFAEGVKEQDTGLAEGAKVTATLDDGKTVTVRFGKEDDKKRVYARVEGDPQLYLISSYSVKTVLKDKLELRDLTLAPFDPAKAERAVFRSPNGTVELAKQDGAWTLVQPATLPDGFEIDLGSVEDKLGYLARLRGAALVDPAPAPAASGLQAPAVSVDITLEGGETKRLAFGGEAPKAEGRGQEFFALGDGGLVYRVAAFHKTRYEKPLELFKKVAAPPPSPSGGVPGMDSLPPDVRKKLEESLRQQGLR